MSKRSSPRFRQRLRKVVWITSSWLLIGIAISAYNAALLQAYGGSGQDPDSMKNFWSTVGAVVVAAPLGGFYLVFFLEKALRTYSYGQVLLRTIFWYSLILITGSLVGSILYNTNFLQESVFAKEVWFNVKEFFLSLDFLLKYIVWGGITLGTSIVLQVNDKYGPGVFRKFLLGKYFHPRREERIFMFLDLRGSTTLAEELGEERFFRFIKEVFNDVTPAILFAKGEIYQYVGDEIIVSWTMENGLENANCLRCFLDIEAELEQRAESYRQKYGAVPIFKAGLHNGPVMAGEIGLVKRDIAYSGDVLNTAARIQSMCNELGVNLLFSEALLTRLPLSDTNLTARQLGEINLRGKRERVVLYSV